MEAKDKTLLAKTKPEDWKLGDLKEFWARQNETDMARQCEFMMGRIRTLHMVNELNAEKRVSVQFLGEIYNNPDISRQPVVKGQVIEVPESRAAYLLETFPKDWQKVKVEKANDTSGTQEAPAIKLNRPGKE